ncbi:hypothetical protein [Nostoc sp. PCC 7120 = FACHB-418]|uniref:hypothetical protein n=1 Tax=Nostoc sp. (strain PCC 7120 / SAG 25.82 / UTEX 2576) TaxID=103690 RepID=UPI000F8D02D5|nr:hypothetical protein [Nostoc sp. PCC 7120 = FACHB-418]
MSYTNQAIASTTCAYAVIACTTNNGVITITCANVIISCRASNLKSLNVREINLAWQNLLERSRDPVILSL